MQRRVVPELMDDPGIASPDHEAALAGLARLNRWSRSDAGLWVTLRNEARHVAPNPLRILDLATGSGDLPVRLAGRAKRAKLNLSFSACDISATALAVAKQNAAMRNVSIEFFPCDVMRDPLPGVIMF